MSSQQTRIVSVSSGFTGITPDINIARESGFEDALERLGETCIGDPAYIGSDHFLAPFKRSANSRLTREQKAFNLLLSKFRNTVERVNRRLKIFQIIHQRWRHPTEKLPLVFHIVCALVNLTFRKRPLDKYE